MSWHWQVKTSYRGTRFSVWLCGPSRQPRVMGSLTSCISQSRRETQVRCSSQRVFSSSSDTQPGLEGRRRGDAPLARAIITAAASFLFPQFIFCLLYCKTRGKHLDLYSQQLCNFHVIKESFINLTLFLFS